MTYLRHLARVARTRRDAEAQQALRSVLQQTRAHHPNPLDDKGWKSTR
jgi:hypothetical protein